MANAELKQVVMKLALARTKVQLIKTTARRLRSVQNQPEGSRNTSDMGRFVVQLDSST
jgi:hypothetical protein